MKTADMEYDVFISYRRDGGEHLAKMMRDTLTEKGYKVFFDVESLRSGEFNKALFGVIENCKDFILICSANALDRCSNEGDWVRQEIECALEHKKNIVPILARGFSFPEKLPASIDDIRWQNGLAANMEFYDAFVEKLEDFLQSQPSEVKKSTNVTLSKKIIIKLIAVAVFVLAVGIGLAVARPWNNNAKNFPVTKEQTDIASELVYLISYNAQMQNSAYLAFEQACEKYEEYAAGKLDYDTMQMYVQNALGNIVDAQNGLRPLDTTLRGKLEATPIDPTAVRDVVDYYELAIGQYIETTAYLSVWAEAEPENTKIILEWLNYYRKLYDLDDQLCYYALNQTLLPIHGELVDDVKMNILPTLHSYYTCTWISDDNELEAKITELFSKEENVVIEIEAYTAAYGGI